MAMSNNEKTAIMVIGSAIFVFYFFIRARINPPGAAGSEGKASADGFTEDNVAERAPLKVPTIDQKELKKSQKVNDAFNALVAYIKAYNAGESQSDLNEMVKDLKRRYSVRVYKRSDGRWAVADSFGKDIIVNNL